MSDINIKNNHSIREKLYTRGGAIRFSRLYAYYSAECSSLLLLQHGNNAFPLEWWPCIV